MADKLNAVKSYVGITDCWHVFYICAKITSLVWVIMMEWTDKVNCIAFIAYHKCRIEKVCIFELLKPLNIIIKGKPGKVKC